MKIKYLLLLLLLLPVRDGYVNDIRSMLMSTNSRFMAKLIQYSLQWNNVSYDSSGKKYQEESSQSRVQFLYDQDHYMLFSNTVHDNGLDDKTTSFYCWTPAIYYELLSGTTNDGAVYLPALRVENSTYNPFTAKTEEGGKKPLVLYHDSWGMYEPFTFGILPLRLLENNAKKLEEQQLNSLETTGVLEVDLSPEYFERFIKGHDETVRSSFIAKLKQSKYGCVISEYESDHILLSQSSNDLSLHYTIKFFVEEINEEGLPIKGFCNYTADYYNGDSLSRKRETILAWQDLSINLIDDPQKYIEEKIQSLPHTSTRSSGNK